MKYKKIKFISIFIGAILFSDIVGKSGEVFLSDINEKMLKVGRDRIIDSGCNNIQNLVTEFSNFARMPDSKFKNQRLNEIIESQINSLKILDENIIIEYNNEVKDIKLKCDYNQLSRVFLNILKNSYESQTKNKKFISVKVTDGIDFIDINIEDSGDGFPENRDKLFEPYITNKIDGTGLGLAICKKIIEDHGGEIYLLNSNDFGGASVRIKLYKV